MAALKLESQVSDLRFPRAAGNWSVRETDQVAFVAIESTPRIEDVEATRLSQYLVEYPITGNETANVHRVGAGTNNPQQLWQGSLRIGNYHWYSQVLLDRSAEVQIASAGWRTRVFDDSSSTDVDDISETIDSALHVVSKYGPDELDLRDLDPEKINGEHLAAVLRATYFVREQVQGWKSAIDSAHKALVKIGADPQDALGGLIANI